MPPYDDDDDETFDEFDLDDLPNEALDELENNAIQFTQAKHNVPPAVHAVTVPSSDYGDDFDDDDLDDNVVIDESRSTPALNPTFQSRPLSQQNQLPRRAASHAPTSYATAGRRAVNPPPLFNQPQRSVPSPRHEPERANHGSQPDKVDQLQRQLDEITRERNALKEDLNSKAGEIAIVRSKQDKTVKEYERELTTLRNLNKEALSKQGRELEAARLAEQAAATERDFLRQDTAEAVRARRVAQVKEKKDVSEPLTPRKKKLLAHRDGFDDDEIEFLSPSKNSPNKLRKNNTPNKPGKRKRKVPDSPAGPLEVIDLAAPPLEEVKSAPVISEALLEKLNVQDDRFDFLGMMLDHKFDKQHTCTIEELGKYTIPSSANETIQSTILGEIPLLGRKSVNNLPVEFCQLILSLWTKCMDEHYFGPVYLFVDILTFALRLKTSLIAQHLMDQFVLLGQRVVEPLIAERFRGRMPLELQPCDRKTGSTACLTLLYMTALGCMCDEIHIIRFWKFMRYDMTMMMFTPNQQMADVELMLKLLSTSISKDSFGAPPSEHEGENRTIINDILDKLTTYLVTIPTKPSSSERYGPEIVANFRLQVLQLLTSMTRSPYAGRFMALHKFLIGRLVKAISDELDVLYDYNPGREASTRIISLATRLLYHLVTTYEDSINIVKKLSVVPGGNQKYLLCLARMNFLEDDLVLEAGIDPDVAACALELLELCVTPEEGDAIHAAFTN